MNNQPNIQYLVSTNIYSFKFYTCLFLQVEFTQTSNTLCTKLPFSYCTYVSIWSGNSFRRVRSVFNCQISHLCVEKLIENNGIGFKHTTLHYNIPLRPKKQDYTKLTLLVIPEACHVCVCDNKHFGSLHVL